MKKKLLKKFSDQNPEVFNKDFILSKKDDAVLPEITNIFKSLEILKQVHIESVEMDTNEEDYGPIKQQGHYYKSPLCSRLTKIHYVISIDGLDYKIEKDLFLPKMLDNCFYINEDVRFFPIWQVVDNLSYVTNNGVSLKSLMMPITLIVNEPFNYEPEFGKTIVEKIPNYYALLFSKKISPLYYVMLDASLKSLERAGISPFENLDKFQTYTDDTLINDFCNFIGLDIKFADDKMDLVEEGRTVFKLAYKKEEGLSFSIKDSDLATERGRVCLGLLLSVRSKDRKNKVVFSKTQFTTPWFWLDTLIDVSGFSKSADPFKRLEKIKAVYTSLERIIDDQTRETLTIPADDKKSIFTIIRYLLLNFDDLFRTDPQDLHRKRVRLYEYILFPLRVYFGQHINRIVNQQTNKDDAKSIEKIFSSLTPMFLLKNLITSQLLRTYNSTNEFDLFNAYLKGTFKGPQALNKGVSFAQRDLNQSYVGKIGLVAASPGDPGVSFTFVPFLTTYNGYFSKEEEAKSKE